MVLTSKQKDDLNRAIAEYLQKSGFSSALRAFEEESQVTLTAPKEISRGPANGHNAISDILEKKWVSITRLQKKVMELECENQRLQEENSQLKRKRVTGDIGGLAQTNSASESHDQDQSFIPKEPAKFNLQGHRSSVTKVAFHPTYSILATSSEDGSIRLWDFESGQLERALKGHTGTVNSVAFAPSGKLMASSSSDLTIRIWDLAQYTCVLTLHGHEHNVSDVAFLPNGDFLLSASRDKTLKLWEVASGYCKKTFRGHNDWVRCLKIHEDGIQFSSGSSDETILLWNYDQEDPKEILRGHAQVVECLAYLSLPVSVVKAHLKGDVHTNQASSQSEEEKNNEGVTGKKTTKATSTMGVNSQATQLLLVSGSRDKTIKIWNPSNATLLVTLTGHDNWVRSLAVHNNNKYLYSVSDDRSLRVWDLEKMRQVRKVHEAHSSFISSISFNPSYLVLATSSVDTSIKLWDLKDY